MTAAESPDVPPRQYGRRTLLKGAAALGVAGPVLWRQSMSLAATPSVGPQWIGYGPDPTSQMYVSWSAGTSTGKLQLLAGPRIRWGLDPTYGSVQAADSSAPVPLPGVFKGEPLQNTLYTTVLLSSLLPGTTYHYSVSNDGITWGPDTTFTTATAGISDFRFTAFGDQATNVNTAGQMVSLVASLAPSFHVIAGDLSYSTPQPMAFLDFNGFHPGQWDNYLRFAGPRGAQSVPWQSAVGAHEVEPLGDNGYAGYVTRFPQPYDLTSGSPVVHAFTYGNVAIIALDGNDLSAQETVKTGYTAGAQTAWLAAKLASYRAAGSLIDFIVVVCNCCCYSSNTNHGSDGGLRDAWGPLFDTYQVDLVISGHVHAYERTNPMRAGQPTRLVGAGGTIDPTTDGTTYICAGGGGNGLYKTWYGPTGAGDAGSKTKPKIWRWTGGDTPAGGSGKPHQLTDSTTNFSAFRRAVFSCLVIDVTAPTTLNNQTTMSVQAMMPTQVVGAVTSIASPVVMDSVSLVRTSQALPPPDPPVDPPVDPPTDPVV